MKRTSSRHILPSAPARGGTTLTEVLVSLLVMSIGVVTLATLFPISVLRSVQATQMTNATMLRYNAESMLKVYPEMVNVAPNWKQDTEYFVGNIVVAHPADGRIFLCSDLTSPSGPNGGGISGSSQPIWPRVTGPGAAVTDGEVEWQLLEIRRNYVIDPLGTNVIFGDYPTPANPAFHEWFGNNGAGDILPAGARLRRFSFGLNTPAGFATLNDTQADRLVTLPDSWVEQVRGFPTNTDAVGAGIVGLTMPPEIDLSSVPIGADSSRIRITDVTGEVSVVRSITNIVNSGGVWQLYWTEDVNRNDTLDAGEDINGNGMLDHYAVPPGTIGEVIIETRERRYSWMLTVRRSGVGTASVDVVIFFRRSFDLEEERVYSALIGDGSEALIRRVGLDGQPGLAGVDDDDNGTVDDATELDWPGTDDRKIRITWPADAEKPFYKRGSYIFDVGNARWYQITDIEELPSGNSAVFTVDKKIKYNGNRAMLMRSVVEVFPLGSKSTRLVP